jgi:hypothetical protein
MIEAVSRQVWQTLKMEDAEDGFDPRDIFMNGSMNVGKYLNKIFSSNLRIKHEKSL